MRSSFPEFTPLTESQFASLWKSAHFVLDTSVLLGMYAYSDESRDDFVELLTAIAERDRLWMPHHVGEEYHAKRLSAVQRERSGCAQAQKHLQTLRKTAAALRGLEQPDLADGEVLAGHVDGAVAAIEAALAGQKAATDWDAQDPVLTALDRIYSGRIGAPSPDPISSAFVEEYQRRLLMNVPPGLKDSQKESNAYGDLLIWLQILEYAESASCDVVFVTGEKKQDWWLRDAKKDECLGPHPRLRREFRLRTGKRFYIYSTKGFANHARHRFGQRLSENTVQEVATVNDVLASARTVREKLAESTDALAMHQLDGIRELSDRLRAALDASLSDTTTANLRAIERMRLALPRLLVEYDASDDEHDAE